MEAKKTWAQRDRAVIWHPFTPQLTSPDAVAFVRGEGVYLYDENDTPYIDAIASWWVNLHGHAHPYMVQKISEQIGKLEHAIFSGYTHEPAIVLAEKLLTKLPYLNKVFYSDDGSTSVEVALKMALQYWHNTNAPRHKIIAFENAYHGDTFGSMSVGARNAFNRAFDRLLFNVIHIPLPVRGQEAESMRQLKLALQQNDIAAFIVEPLIQGAAGMYMYDAQTLDTLFAKARAHQVVLIADEVMTGFGRTGTWFASDQLLEKPDIICLSKGLTGGFLPLGATLCNEKIYNAYLVDDKYKTFFHGHSYTANPTACAAAIASFELMERDATWEAIQRISTFQRQQVEQFKNHPAIAHARCLGTIAAFELRSNQQTEYLNPLADRLLHFFAEQKIILRPLGNIVYVLPPYCISDAELTQVYTILNRFLETLAPKQ